MVETVAFLAGADDDSAATVDEAGADEAGASVVDNGQ